MLSAIWGADNCFKLLVDFGGCDLSLRDSRGADVYNHANSYRRADIVNMLNTVRQKGVVMVNVNTAKLQQTVNLDEMLVAG